MGSAGLELVIPDVNFEDAGVYRCKAQNSDKQQPVVVDITLDVQCRKYIVITTLYLIEICFITEFLSCALCIKNK